MSAEAVDAVRIAADALVALGVAAGETETIVRAEAGALAAMASERARGADAEWANAFGGRASGFAVSRNRRSAVRETADTGSCSAGRTRERTPRRPMHRR